MDLVFCGTPEFAVPTLKALLEAADFTLRMVVCQPDRPAGRGLEVTPPPVKRLAEERGIPIAQPAKLKDNPEFRSRLESIQPAAIVVVAYGRIIPPWMLALPPFGNVNLHASLLPKYRGAAPIQWAVASGETATGVTTMRLDAGLDTGDILLQATMSIAPDDTSETLAARLAALGAPLMLETLRGQAAGRITPRPQDPALATYAPLLKKEDGRISIGRSAVEIANRLRGFLPWPGAHGNFRGKTLNLWDAAPAQLPPGMASLSPGELAASGGRLFLGCAQHSALEIHTLQVEGKKRMSAADFIHGYRPHAGEKLEG
jgi:methionyl-tRNA formyltransferase